MRSGVLLIASFALGMAGCKGASHAPADLALDDVAATPPAGVSIQKLDTEDKVALDYLDPVGVEIGVVDAAHVIADGDVTYSLYEYQDSAAVEAAMGLWRQGVIGDPLMGIQETADDLPTIEGAITLTSPKGIIRVVAPVGNRVVAVTALDGRTVGRVSGLLVQQLGGTVK